MENNIQKTPVQLPPEIIKEIAEQIDSGMICYYQLSTGELLTVPDKNRFPGFDDGLWKDDLEKADKIAFKSIVFTGMETRESFRLMEDFIDIEVDAPKIKEALLDALDRPKPFRRFLDRLHDFPDVLEQWYRYRENRMMEYVRELVDFYNRVHKAAGDKESGIGD